MRTIIIGDIHGCYREFISLLKKVRYRSRRDRLILLGDLMDRGPRSYEMLRWAMHWKEKYPDTFFLIRGNHEQMLVEQSKALDTRLIWRVVGKGASLRSFRRHGDKMTRYIPWILKNMPIYHIDEGFRCVHASIERENPEENSLGLLVKDHSQARKNLYGGKITIIGHTPLPEPTHYDGSGGPGIGLEYHVRQPLPDHGTICIDTGCVFGGKLTAMIIRDGMYELESVESGVHVVNKAHQYVGYIRKFCSLPVVREFCSGSESR